MTSPPRRQPFSPPPDDDRMVWSIDPLLINPPAEACLGDRHLLDRTVPNIPVPDTPSPGYPVPETPLPDIPVPDTTLPDIPVPGTPLPDIPVPGIPLPDIPVPATPLADMPVLDESSSGCVAMRLDAEVSLPLEVPQLDDPSGSGDAHDTSDADDSVEPGDPSAVPDVTIPDIPVDMPYEEWLLSTRQVQTQQPADPGAEVETHVPDKST